MSVNKRYDVVVFGASGYTGQYVVEELARISQEEKISFAISGRNQAKLEKVLVTASRMTGIDIAATPVILADVADENSLKKMASSARVVINCVGPYRFYGEQVVRACVENGAHHVDVSGEPQYLERMVVSYNEAARDNKVYVVGACGFDSIPNDMGCAFLIKHFGGQVNSIESYLDISSTGRKSKRVNFGTWQSAIHGIAHADELSSLRRRLYKEKFPKAAYPLQFRGYLHKSPINPDTWCIPFPGSDRSVVKRSQYYRYTEEGEKPVQMQAYYTSGSFLASVCIMLFGIFFAFMAKFEFTRGILERFPTAMSMGMVTKDGPSREDFDKTNFSITLIGCGWGSEVEDSQQTEPNKSVKVRVVGAEPGYITTSMCVVQSAIVLLSDADKLPQEGGVYTTATAFSNTSLIERLQKHGLQFSVIDS